MEGKVVLCLEFHINTSSQSLNTSKSAQKKRITRFFLLLREGYHICKVYADRY